LSNDGEKVAIGRVTGPHGVRGEVKVMPYGGVEDFIWKRVYLSGRPNAVVIRKAGSPEPEPPEGVVVKKTLKVRSVRRHGSLFLVTFEGVVTREEAAALRGFTVEVPRDELPVLAEGEYYYRDLIGLEVETVDGRTLGTVKDIITTGGSDVLDVKGPDGETMLPLSEDVIKEIDTEGGRITVRLLPGLIEEDKE